MKLYAAQLLLLVVVLAAPCCTTVCRASGAAPPKCDLQALLPCLPAFIRGAAPSDKCCAELREQQKPCLCRYGQNPALGWYISSRDGKRIAHHCGVRVRGFRC